MSDVELQRGRLTFEFAEGDDGGELGRRSRDDVFRDGCVLMRYIPAGLTDPLED